MNEKIEALAKQAGMVMYPTGLGIKENTLWGDRNIAKFAELLIKECARISTNADDTMTNQGEASAQAFMEHFGVK
jgi:hypothetical protein